MRGDLGDQFLFELGQFVERAFELLGPQDRAAFRIEQLRSHTQDRHAAAYIAFKDVAHPQAAGHRLDIGDLALPEPRDGAAGQDAQFRRLRHGVDDVFHQPDGEDIVFLDTGPVLERQPRERRKRAFARLWRRGRSTGRGRCGRRSG